MPASLCFATKAIGTGPLRLVHTHATYTRTHVDAGLLAQYVSEVVAAVAESPRNVKDTPAIVHVRVGPRVALDTGADVVEKVQDW